MSATAMTPYLRAYQKFRDFLRRMLRPILEVIERSDDPDVGNRMLREKYPKEALAELGEQVGMYWQDKFPFRNA